MHKLVLRMFGRRALFLFGDSAVWDRFRWMTSWLPETADNLRLLDVGCGNGAFTIEAAARGYDAVGLTWDAAASEKAARRAKLLDLSPSFVAHDARRLDQFEGGLFDVAINFENIEHILDDQKLLTDIAGKLKPGGVLLLTTPYQFYRGFTKQCAGPHRQVEDGGHVRRGYSEQRLREMASNAGLKVEAVEFCTGPASKGMITLQRALPLQRAVSLLLVPFKIVAHIFDRLLRLDTRKGALSICMVMQKLG